jgi:hypothetical protein
LEDNSENDGAAASWSEDEDHTEEREDQRSTGKWLLTIPNLYKRQVM